MAIETKTTAQPIAQPTHSYRVQIFSPADDDCVYDDSDFAAEARFDWFEQVVRETAEPGELIKLLDGDKIVLSQVRES